MLASWDGTGLWSQLDPNDPSKGVQVTFRNGDICGANPRQVTFQFPCANTTAPSFTVTVSRTNTCWYTATLPTSVSCLPMPTCNATLNGHVYDLSSLFDAWGLNATEQLYNYRFNPCGIVQSEWKCDQKGGLLCQYSPTGTFVSAIATFINPPAPTWAPLDPNDPNVGVTLTFTNGDVCWYRGEQKTRVATFKFACSNQPSDAYNVTETSPCIYEIDMATPAACPQSARGSWSE